MSASTVASVPRREGYRDPCAIYCGREGFLSFEEFLARTEADVQRYIRDNPLRWKTANRQRHPNGRPVHPKEILSDEV